jgi:tRNA-2-methylthio-N6-dimethylallyladenosine synthase
MNRRYTASQYIDLVGMIRSYLPGIALSTDILVGFPGETEKDVEATISLMESVRFSEAYTYYYNPIDGTPASLRTDSVPEEEKLERLSRVITIQQRITREEKIKRLGTVPEVFAERISKRSEAEILGRTPQNDMAVFPGDPSLIGSFLRIRLKSLSGNTFYGEVQA